MRAVILFWTLAVVVPAQAPPLGLDLHRPAPASNPMTSRKAALGRALFYDARLSGDGTVSCATCHVPSRAFTDGRAVAVGTGGRRGRRNTPTLVNRVYGRAFFWDGRAASLESQVREPMLNPREMGGTAELVIRVVREDLEYRRGFADAFGRPAEFDDVASAIATYVRTIQSGDSRLDRYRHGDASALTPLELRGMRLFYGTAQCGSCHAGPTFSDERFHNTGVAYRDGQWQDEGRFAVSGQDRDLGAFKTPTLREVHRTAPYMHDGSLETLERVIDFYDRGGRANPHLDSVVRPIGLEPVEKQALVAFLRVLSGQITEVHRR